MEALYTLANLKGREKVGWVEVMNKYPGGRSQYIYLEGKSFDKFCEVMGWDETSATNNNGALIEISEEKIKKILNC